MTSTALSSWQLWALLSAVFAALRVDRASGKA